MRGQIITAREVCWRRMRWWSARWWRWVAAPRNGHGHHAQHEQGEGRRHPHLTVMSEVLHLSRSPVSEVAEPQRTHMPLVGRDVRPCRDEGGYASRGSV